MADENEGIFALGRCYKQGIGTEEDWDKALEWFGKGAEKNESRCLTELGLAYENGNRIQIKRRQFEKVIDKLDAI